MASSSSDQKLVDDVVLSPDLVSTLLDSLRLGLGLRALRLASVCRVWCEAAATQRSAWRVLRLERTLFGGYGSELGQLIAPSDVAALPDGGICVAEANNHRLQCFFPRGGPRIIGSVGVAPGQLLTPSGIALLGDALFVSDSGNCRVQKLRFPSGEPLACVGRFGSGVAEFKFPQGLCVAGESLFVADRNNARVVVLDPAHLAWRSAFGCEGVGDGEFLSPRAVVTDGGELFVADRTFDRIQASVSCAICACSPAQPLSQVFSGVDGAASGEMAFARSFGTRGAAPGQLKGPSPVPIPNSR